MPDIVNIPEANEPIIPVGSPVTVAVEAPPLMEYVIAVIAEL